MMNGGEINIRKTHPFVYRLIMSMAFVSLALGWNFIQNQPTFLIYDLPNVLWGGIFLAVGLGQILALNFYRRLRLVRASLAFSAAYMAVLAWGTSTPYREGTGSLQLPIFYAGWCLIQLPMLFEPFINPWTARSND